MEEKKNLKPGKEESKKLNPEEVSQDKVVLEKTELTKEESESVSGGGTNNIFGLC